MREDPFSGEKAVIIADNNEAMEIILRLGVLEKVTKSIALGQRLTVFHKIHWHTKCWVLVGNYQGFDTPEENGWLVAIWPKLNFPASEMDRYITTTCRDIINVIDLTDSETNN